MYLNKELYKIQAYLSNEDGTLIVYFRKNSISGYGVLKIDLEKLSILNLEGKFSEKDITLCKEYLSTDRKFKYIKKLDNDTFEYLIYNNRKQKTLKTSNNRYFSDEFVEYIDTHINEGQLGSDNSSLDIY